MSKTEFLPPVCAEHFHVNFPDSMDDAVPLPINGVLDLHTFRPAEVKDLVPDYLAECRARGITQVRIIHGKGTGTLRETVHAVLRRLPEVAHFRIGDETAGGWGATLVELRPAPDTPRGRGLE